MVKPTMDCQIRPSADPRTRQTSHHQPTREGRILCGKGKGRMSGSSMLARTKVKSTSERRFEERTLLSSSSASASKLRLGKTSAGRIRRFVVSEQSLARQPRKSHSERGGLSGRRLTQIGQLVGERVERVADRSCHDGGHCPAAVSLSGVSGRTTKSRLERAELGSRSSYSPRERPGWGGNARQRSTRP